MAAPDPLGPPLPHIARLALTYAPPAARQQTLALLALDTHLAGLVRRSREPMLAQLRLAWWREALDRDSHEWPHADPILGALRSWGDGHRALIPLVEGWEAITAPAPLGTEAVETFAQGRAAAAEALAAVLGCSDDAAAAGCLGRIWAIEDLSMRVGREDERELAFSLAMAQPAALPRVGRLLRPLRVLAGLARRRRVIGSEEGALSPAALLHALRLGLLGL